MNSVSEYNSLLNKFGKKLEAMIESDFPGDTELSEEINIHLVRIQFAILDKFLKG